MVSVVGSMLLRESTSTGKSEEQEGRGLLVFAHIGFLLTGIVATLLGALLPLLTVKWKLDDRAAGGLFIAQFAGSIAGLWLSNRLVALCGVTRSLACGFALMTGGVAIVGIGSAFVGWSAILIYGIGLGLTLPAINLLVAEANPRRCAAALNILNFVWGIGAASSAPFVMLFVARSRNDVTGGMTTQGLLVLALTLGAVACFLACLRGKGAAKSGFDDDVSVTPPVEKGRRRLFVLFCAMMFFYVGAESAVGGWIALYALRVSTQDVAWAGYAPMIFWASLLAGRCLAPFLLRFVSDEKLVLISLGIAVFGIAQLSSGFLPGGLITGIVGAGFGFATVFPNTLAALTQCFGARTKGVTRWAFTLATLGGAVMPWAVGAVSDSAGNLRFGLAVILCVCALMIALQCALMRYRRGLLYK